ncbi:MAG: hypothetical protein GY841_02760 [FCB group bacterium]|nr:hypothetical protein [FCB group bacterium]
MKTKHYLVIFAIAFLAAIQLPFIFGQSDSDSLKYYQAVAKNSPAFYLDVAKGNIPGHASMNKFGHNATATAGDDIWAGDGVYAFYPATAQSMDIQSTEAADTAAGTGARSVTVFGLDENWEEISETKELKGGTAVDLDNKYIRMFRAFVSEAGSGKTNAGDITVEIKGAATVAIFIADGEGQTQQAIYTVPAGKSAYFIKGYVGLMNDNKGGEDGSFQWLMRANNGANGAWQVKGHVGLVNIGSSHWQYEYGIPAGPIPEKTDVRVKLVAASDTMSCVAGFDLILVDD